MGAIINSMSVSYTDNKAPITFYVRYSDNGTSDTLQKKLNSKEEAKKWLSYWYGDTSGGFEYLARAEEVVNNLND